MATLGIHSKTFQVKLFANKKEGDAMGNAWLKFTSMTELMEHKTFTGADLVKAYNSLMGSGKQIKKFADRKTGVKRLFQMAFGGLKIEPKKSAKIASAKAMAEEAENKSSKPAKTAGGKRGTKGRRALFLTCTMTTNPMRPNSWSFTTIQTIIDNPGIQFEDLVKNRNGRPNTVSAAIRAGIVVGKTTKN